MTLHDRPAGRGHWLLLLGLAAALGSAQAGDDLAAADVLATTVRDLYAAGRFAEAVEPAEQALALRERLLGAEHAEVAASLNDLSAVYWQTARYGEAEEALRRANEISRRLAGDDDLGYANGLNNLGILLQTMGRFAEAAECLREALTIREAVLGEVDSLIGSSLHNLASIEISLGRYDRAEPLLLRSLEVRREVFGEDHRDTAQSLNALGELYRRTGRDEAAAEMLARSVAIDRRLRAPHDHLRTTALVSLAVVRARLGQTAEAEELLSEATEIALASHGPEHPHYATALARLAGLDAELGRYEQAAARLSRSLSIRRTALGDEHPEVADSLIGLALLAHRRERPDEAVKHLAAAVEMLRATYGDRHPQLGNALLGLAELEVLRGQWANAEVALEQAMQIQDHSLRHVFPGLTEPEKLAYLRTLRGSLDLLLRLAWQGRQDRALVQRGLDWTLRRKGIVLRSLLEQRAATAAPASPAAARRRAQAAVARRQLAELAYQGIGEQSTAAYRERYANLEQRIESIEKELALSQAGPAVADEAVAIADLQQAMPAGSALVEFIAVTWPPAGGRRYLAFVQRADTAWPTLLDLGEADRIDAAVAAFRAAVGDPNSDPQAPAQRLHAAIWQPLVESLAEVDRIFVSPDGELSLVAFGAIGDETGRFLVERHVFQYLVSSLDLGGRPRAEPRGPVAVYADADFAAGDRTVGAEAASATVAGIGFPSLPGTRTEARQVVAACRRHGAEATTRLNREATEESLKALTGPAILHLATHGFYLPETMPTVQPAATAGLDRFIFVPMRSAFRGVGGTVPLDPILVEDPMHRSGFALAGATHALGQRDRLQGEEDGLVSAAEAASLDLDGTRLVVLSACETGVGQATWGDGVVGLRRALLLAGAGELVTALWRVPDAETAGLMAAFYDRYLAVGDAGQSLTAAQRQLIAARRAAGEPDHPFYWGAFTASGGGGEAVRPGEWPRQAPRPRSRGSVIVFGPLVALVVFGLVLTVVGARLRRR